MSTEFRLPGFGGAAVFLRRTVASARMRESDAPGTAFDVGLLSPDRLVWYQQRVAEDDFVDRLGAFLLRAAADFHPEKSLDVFADRRMGLTVSVRTSTDSRVELEFEIVEEEDVMSFETSRVALAAAADALSALGRRHYAEPTGEM
ncbi:hypothetical protein [Rhodococcus sp. NPDC127528]|uniref:hypothetical protein n=1 Tax=unclassified Rhodococcus (in: high G+C Gram-positive bacteria) TaxID=192944 RepID=UPI00363732DB